ncbi:MAG: DUF4258 domain-containing protein [Proteobacteria bacterium]|nr:DUF4258 domain-containing protein [Candidatus Enterousia onthequi]
MNTKVIKFQKKLSPTDATNKIREIAMDSDNIIITNHTIERMQERDFSMRDLLELLRNGYVDQEPEYNAEKQEYKYKIARVVDTRTAAAITIIMKNEKLLVITIMWKIY